MIEAIFFARFLPQEGMYSNIALATEESQIWGRLVSVISAPSTFTQLSVRYEHVMKPC